MDLTGKVIAFTGIAVSYDRDTIYREIRQRGGAVATSVNAKTDLLVLGENLGSGVSKRENAAKLGIPNVMANEFMAKISNDQAKWNFPLSTAKAERAAKARGKKAAVKPNKEVVTAIKAMSKQDAMPGFVGF